MIIAVCVLKLKESEQYHNTGNLMDGAPPGLKTDRDHLLKDNLGFCEDLEMVPKEKRRRTSVEQ